MWEELSHMYLLNAKWTLRRTMRLRLQIVGVCKRHPLINNPMGITLLAQAQPRTRTLAGWTQLFHLVELEGLLVHIKSTQLWIMESHLQWKLHRTYSLPTHTSSSNVSKDREKTWQPQISWNWSMTCKKRSSKNRMTLFSVRTTGRRVWILASANTRALHSWCQMGHQASLTSWVHRTWSET